MTMETAIKIPFFYVVSLVVCAIGFVIYFAPSFIGKNKTNSRAIFALNLFGGWTFVGWLVALVWALTQDSKESAGCAAPLDMKRIFTWYLVIQAGLNLILVPVVITCREQDKREEAAYLEARRNR